MSNFCKKAIGTNNNIIGQWQWKYSIGGIAVQTITASDTHVILTFQQVSTYTLSENGTIQSNDQFFITYDSTYKNCTSPQFYIRQAMVWAKWSSFFYSK